MEFQELTSSLPDVLIKNIYLYIPHYLLFPLSKTTFTLFIDDYYEYCKRSNRGVFYYNKINNTYIRYLIRNNIYLFMQNLLYKPYNVPFNKIKRFYYNNKSFKTYIDYCIFLANSYESEHTKQLLIEYKVFNRI